MVTKKEIKEFAPVLHDNPEMPVDILDILWEHIDPLTQQAIEKDVELQAAIEIAREAVLDQHRNYIRELANKLPEDDPLRLAIETTVS